MKSRKHAGVFAGIALMVILIPQGLAQAESEGERPVEAQLNELKMESDQAVPRPLVRAG